jgi:hypothetical protein
MSGLQIESARILLPVTIALSGSGLGIGGLRRRAQF